MSWVRVAVAFVLLSVGLLPGQPTSQFEPVSVIDSTKSLKVLFPQPIIMARDLSPDGKQIAYLAMADVEVGAPLWLVTLEISTKRIVAFSGLRLFFKGFALASVSNEVGSHRRSPLSAAQYF